MMLCRHRCLWCVYFAAHAHVWGALCDHDHAKLKDLHDHHGVRVSPLPTMLRIPAGTTVIGTDVVGGGVAIEGRPNGDFDERPQQLNVQVGSFYLGETEVTNMQYEQYDPAHRSLRGLEGGYSKGDNEAVVFVSVENATGYCNWLSRRAHSMNSTGPLLRYRLPSEIEWERAARAGTTSNFFWGDKFDSTAAHAPGSVCPTACPNLTVGQFKPNQLGIFDTVGNVEEWTSTPYRPYPGASPDKFTEGMIVTRGGSHSDSPYTFYLRASNRAATLPSAKSSQLGFRVAADTQEGNSVDNPERHISQHNVHHSGSMRHSSLDKIGSLRKHNMSTTSKFYGPFEYVRFSDDVHEDSGGPLFLQHNHAPALGILPGGETLLLGWFSTVSENGREPSYAFSTMKVGDMPNGQFEGEWANASLLWKAADRGQQTQAFHSNPNTGALSWYAAVSPQAGYTDAAVVRRELLPSGVWNNATFVTWNSNHVPSHEDGHIPFERVVDFKLGNVSAMAMPATYIGTSKIQCDGCPNAAASVVLVSLDGGKYWNSTGAYMSGISQFVELRNGSWFALGRGGGGYPAYPTSKAPGMTRSVSHDKGASWKHGWEPTLWPLGVGVRHVMFRLQEGPIILVSFTWGSNVTTITGKQRLITGLYVATSEDECNTFVIRKPLVNENISPRMFPTLDGNPWHMTNATAEPRGYTSARQTADGMIHVVTSRLSYHFNFQWLITPPPDAPNAPTPSPSPPAPPLGPPIPAGTWYTPRQDWKMRSPTARRTILAVQSTTVKSNVADGHGNSIINVSAGWAFVLPVPPVSTGPSNETWMIKCPCTRI